MSVVHDTLKDGTRSDGGGDPKPLGPIEYARRESALRERIRALESDAERLVDERDRALESLETMRRTHAAALAEAENLRQELLRRLAALEHQVALQPMPGRRTTSGRTENRDPSPSLLRQARARKTEEE